MHSNSVIEATDLRPGSDFRKEQEKIQQRQYGIVSFPRSGHNWLSRMIAEVVRRHNLHDSNAQIGRAGGMGRYVGLKAQAPSQVAAEEEFFAPFPVIYGSHGDMAHDGYDPNTRVYLWRGFRAVWKSTKKTMAETGKPGTWWGQSWIDCHTQWKYHRKRFSRVPLQIRYEDLIRNPRAELIKIIEDMGVLDVEDETFDAAIQAGSRANMRKEQAENGSPNPFTTIN